MAKERKLDIFAALRAIDQRDGDWFARQSEEAQKEFVGLVAMRWTSCVREGDDAIRMLWLINQRVNRHLFNGLSQHPELTFRLLASCGTGKLLSRKWTKGHSKSYGNNIALDLLAIHHPLANNYELRLLLSQYTSEEFSVLLDDCGIPKNEIKSYLEAHAKLA